MENIRAWLQDKKNMPIVAAGSAIIVIIVALVILKNFGVLGGGGSSAPSSTMQTSPDAFPAPGMTPGTPGMTPSPGTPGAVDPGAMATGGVSPTADPWADDSGGAVASASAALPKQSPMLPYRKDPFLPFAGAPTVRNVIASIVPNVSRPRLAPVSPVVYRESGEPLEEPEEILPPQPFRRMAGVMMNGRVSAILETNGVAEIVRPGSISREDPTVMVERIEQTAIVLKTLNTRTPMTIRVNLAGAIDTGVAAPTAPTPGPGGIMMPGMPPAPRPGTPSGPINP